LERTSRLELYNRYEKYPQPLSEEALRQLHRTAGMYLRRVEDSLAFLREHSLREVLGQLGRSRLPGVQLWTSCPQHNFLPFFEPASADRFVARGVESFQEVFGREPDGFWLPECAFQPGLERVLTRHGVRRTALSLHGIGAYQPQDPSGVYRHEDLEVLVHDYRIGLHLWKSPEATFPAHPVYREFFRDMGFDVIPEYFDELGVSLPSHKRGHVWTGLKYHAVSGQKVGLGEKALYDEDAARAQVPHHVRAFWELLESRRSLVQDGQTFVLAFDTELFGHWWHEGIEWLEGVMQPEVPPEASVTVAPQPPPPPSLPRLYYSTWGRDFYSEHWLTPSNSWMYALIKLVEAHLPEPVSEEARELWRRFEVFSGSDLLFMMPDSSQRERARSLFLARYEDVVAGLPTFTPELLAAFPVDPFKCLLVHVTQATTGTAPPFQLRRLSREDSRMERPREITLEPEVIDVAGLRVCFQYFLLHPQGRYALSVEGSERRHLFQMPDYGVPLLIAQDARAYPKYDPEALYRKLGEIWQGDERLPIQATPTLRSRHVYTHQALAEVLGGKRAAVFKYNKEGYALLRFRAQALAPVSAVFDDTVSLHDAGAYIQAGAMSVPVSSDPADIARAEFDAVIFTCSLNFESEVPHVRALLEVATRRKLPVVSLYDDILYYDLFDGLEVDPTLFYRVAVPEHETGSVQGPADYRPRNLLGVFGTDTVQGKFTTQIYLREALARHVRVRHHSTEPTGILLGADTGYSRVVRAESAQRLAFERGLMAKLTEGCDLVITGGQNGLLYTPPGGDRRSNASTFIYETFLPRLVVLTVSVDTAAEEVLATREYLETLAREHGVPCAVVGLAMMGGRKLHGSRWTETWFLGVRDEVLEEARQRLEQHTGLRVYAIPEEADALAQAVLTHL
jgi:1,4-alpha-glucan branching enzyme